MFFNTCFAGRSGGAERKTRRAAWAYTARRVSSHGTPCWLLFAAVFLMLASCTPKTPEQKRLVPSVGLPSELLLVVDPEVWNSDLADSLTQLLKGPVPGLMQEEPFFRLTRVLTPNFKPAYSTLHSQFFVRLDPSLAEPVMGVSRNVVSRPQIRVTLAAPSLDVLRAYLYKYGSLARQHLADAQIEMRAAQLRRKHSKRVAADLDSVLGLSIMAPTDMMATKKRDHFLWAGTNRNEKDLNLVVYSYPWDGTEIRTPEHFVSHRDSVMQAHIPGSQPDQWMQTTRVDDRPIVFSEIRTLRGRRIQEVRGLWQMRNGAMGGPFVSHVVIDTAATRVVVAEGFVYSPSTDKRDLLRTLEASLSTLKKSETK